MGKIAIITDSTAYLSKEIIEKYNINVVPLTVNFGTETYKEGIDISSEKFYQVLGGKEELPTTSQPAIGEFVNLYERLAEEYDEAIAIHLSSGISGTMSTSLSASQMVEGINVEVIDSETACYGIGFMVIEAAEMANKGYSLPEIKERINWLIKKMKAYFVVDDLSYLHRGGRLNAAQYLVGSMLKIKPIIYFKDTKLEPYEKVRTKKKALDRIQQMLEEDARDGSKIKCSVVQANVKEDAEKIKKEIETKYPNIEANVSDFGPVIGSHTGPGTLGLLWYKL